MSEARGAERQWRFYVADMIEFAEKVLRYTAGVDQAGFLADPLTYDATLRNLELIGEAATHVPEQVRSAHPDIPWRLIIATRNRLIHAGSLCITRRGKQALRIGMGCKAQTAAIAGAIARICNAADRPSP